MQQGNDGAAAIHPTDGSHPVDCGWNWDVNSGAPHEAKIARPVDGKMVVDKTVPNWTGAGNPHASAHMHATVGQERVYIDENVDKTNTCVSNNCHFSVEFF